VFIEGTAPLVSLADRRVMVPQDLTALLVQ